jgi:hypothetical protein
LKWVAFGRVGAAQLRDVVMLPFEIASMATLPDRAMRD